MRFSLFLYPTGPTDVQRATEEAVRLDARRQYSADRRFTVTKRYVQRRNPTQRKYKQLLLSNVVPKPQGAPCPQVSLGSYRERVERPKLCSPRSASGRYHSPRAHGARQIGDEDGRHAHQSSTLACCVMNGTPSVAIGACQEVPPLSVTVIGACACRRVAAGAVVRYLCASFLSIGWEP